MYLRFDNGMKAVNTDNVISFEIQDDGDALASWDRANGNPEGLRYSLVAYLSTWGGDDIPATYRIKRFQTAEEAVCCLDRLLSSIQRDRENQHCGNCRRG